MSKPVTSGERLSGEPRKVVDSGSSLRESRDFGAWEGPVLADEYRPEFESLKGLLLEIAQERRVADLLNLVVGRLACRAHVALARIWLINPGDICASCPMRTECPDRSFCLHLVASAGASVAEPTADWSRLDGRFRRFPVGRRKIGEVAATGEERVIRDLAGDHTWIANPLWAEREGIRGFAGEPIIYRGEVLGVIGLFTRIPIPDEGPVWLRLIADHAAIAIANARAFEEIERLKAQLELENAYLKEEMLEAQSFGDLVGQSAPMRRMARQIELVAPTDASVLILGESGTGKELVAREIHRHSRRRDRPLVRVNCAAVPRELYESEFFGHVRGAFTGAVKDRAGRFAAAHGGTLFLDEVGEIPLELQSKLLRVLQEGQYERVGEERTKQVDVRIIAATNRDLKTAVAEGRFRQDLYFRLNVFPIEVAPLRNRQEDLPVLAAHFLKQTAKRLTVAAPSLSQSQTIRLQSYDWPGNVRELQNIIERSVITARSGKLFFDIPSAEGESTTATQTKTAMPPAESRVLTDAEIRRYERMNLEKALREAGYKIYGPGGAADLLGIKPTTLASRMKRLGLNVKRQDPRTSR